MGEERLSDIVIINIKREFRENVLDNYVDRNIEIFGKKKAAAKYSMEKHVLSNSNSHFSFSFFFNSLVFLINWLPLRL